MNSQEIKVALLQYYRYDRQYKLVALEAYHFHNADVVCVNNRGWIIETEVKISISDMKADINKQKHEALSCDYLKAYPAQVSLMHKRKDRTSEATKLFYAQYAHLKPEYKYSGHEFYFAIPEELAEEASHIRNSYYPYAGLILVRPEPHFYSLSMFGIRIAMQPYHFTKPKADIKFLSALVKDQSATLTRLAVLNCQLVSKLNGMEEKRM